VTGTDIRAWAREQGLDVNARGPVNKAVVELYDAEHGGPAEPETVFDAQGTGAPDLEPMAKDETTPTIKRPGLKSKLTETMKPRAPRGGGRRQSLERLGGLVWSGMSNVVAAAGMVPAARMISMQAPIAGIVIEDSLKGTAADRMAQPVARMLGRGGDLGALFGPVVLVTAIQKKPELYPQLRPYLEDALWSYVEVAGPAFKKLEERKAKRAAMLDEGFDMEGLIQSLFAPVPGQEAAADEQHEEDPS
jgi:hypothetical protein